MIHLAGYRHSVFSIAKKIIEFKNIINSAKGKKIIVYLDWKYLASYQIKLIIAWTQMIYIYYVIDRRFQNIV